METSIIGVLLVCIALALRFLLARVRDKAWSEGRLYGRTMLYHGARWFSECPTTAQLIRDIAKHGESEARDAWRARRRGGVPFPDVDTAPRLYPPIKE